MARLLTSILKLLQSQLVLCVVSVFVFIFNLDFSFDIK